MLIRLTFAACSLALLSLSAAAATAADGAAVFGSNCAKCHGAAGGADTPVAKAMKVPALADKSLTADQVKAALQEKKSHAAIKSKFSEEEIAALATFLGTLGGS